MSEITFEQLSVVDVRVGLVTAAEKVEKSEKLLKLTVLFGEKPRTVVSGIAKTYESSTLIGQKFLFVTNLPPCKVMGITSEAMIFGAENELGEVVLCVPNREVANGTRFG